MGVVFQEIPDEVTLSLNISACPCHCLGCHSEYLWDDIGILLDEQSLATILSEYARDITCLCFMGGDADPETVNRLANWVKETYPALKIGWYSGRSRLSEAIELCNFDFVKIGPFVQHLGGLDHETTNQRLYAVVHSEESCSLEDITYRFWKKR